MYKNTYLHAAAVLSMAITVTTVGSARAGVDKIFDDRMKGGVASGYAQIYADGWCEYTYVQVEAHENRGESTNTASIYLSRQNYCNQTYTSIPNYSYMADGVLVPPTNKLEAAQLSDTAVFPVEHCDYSSGETVCTPGEARVAASWTGFGNTYQGHSSNHAKYGPMNPADKFVYISHSRWNGAERDASVEFQVEIDGIPIDFSSGYSYGTLRYVKSGSVTMERITP